MVTGRYTVRAASAKDLVALRTILEYWMTEDGSNRPRTADIEHTLDMVNTAVNGQGSLRFLVADDGTGTAVGMIGFTTADIDGDFVDEQETCGELVNAYVDPAQRGTGIGTLLADAIERMAADEGCTHLIVVSGSRNRAYGYPFWTKRYGPPLRRDENFFAPGAERVVWKVRLNADQRAGTSEPPD